MNSLNIFNTVVKRIDQARENLNTLRKAQAGEITWDRFTIQVTLNSDSRFAYQLLEMLPELEGRTMYGSNSARYFFEDFDGIIEPYADGLTDAQYNTLEEYFNDKFQS